MTDKKFSVVHDLESLSEEQRKQYLRDGSGFLGLDPDLNLLDIIWMSKDDGMRRPVVYARRGTTDILRDKHHIEITSLEQHDGPGYVSFKATGKNKLNRQEIAVGAHSVEGFKGERLAAAIATAQTRALRRLTLQFVGGGILDESEIVSSTTNIASEGTPLSTLALAPASVARNNEPGKDITFPTKAVSDQEQFERDQAQLRADAVKHLNELSKKQEASEPVPEDSMIAAKKPRKPRGSNKPKVDLGPSEPVPVKVMPEVPVKVMPEVPVVQAPIEPTVAPAPVAVETPGQPIVPAKPRLTKDQIKPFLQRLFKVVNDSLEPNGFAPKEGMGNTDKMRAFAGVMFSDVTNMNELSIEQWEKYLSTLENKVSVEGPAATVKYIEDAIGI